MEWNWEDLAQNELKWRQMTEWRAHSPVRTVSEQYLLTPNCIDAPVGVRMNQRRSQTF
jgi:hypothetical protein